MNPAARASRAAGIRRVRLLVTLLALLEASCRAGAAPLPPAPAVVEITMREYAYEYERPIPRGRVVFRVRNEGSLQHELVLIIIPEGVPPLDQQLRGSERRVVSTFVSMPPRAPGGTGTFAVDLEPQRYGLVCFVTDPDGQQHALKGMSSEFRVT
ncbi:MAG: hypothetical protein ACRDJ4_00785 [Actinomycetota bacterium]